MYLDFNANPEINQPKSLVPKNSPLYRKIEEIAGPIPPLEQWLGPSHVLISGLLMQKFHSRLRKYGISILLTLLIGAWLRGDGLCSCEDWNFDASDRQDLRLLARLGLVSYSERLDLVALSEEAIVTFLSDPPPKKKKKGN